MSSQSSPSPPPGPMADIDETKLPNGQCRYILLTPEIKGHRCGCVGFTLNRSLPGVSCECGHLSCYHLKAAEQPPDKAQLDLLLRRVQALEGQLDRENTGGLGSALGDVVRRLGDLEEQYEKSKDDFSQENRGIYRQITSVWQAVDQAGRRQVEMQNRLAIHDARLDERDDNMQRLEKRLMESDDAAIDLEERVDRLEESETPGPRRRRRSSSESRVSKNSEPTSSSRHGVDDALAAPATAASFTLARRAGSASGRSDRSAGAASGPWTVHVSLMPMASVAFPFEKDTNAYKRCLSRGLHQMIAVQGADSDAFAAAITTAFGRILNGRPWMPLQARLCDAETLLGLPMLRPLDPALLGAGYYDQEFLRKHCAVCGPNGKLDSLYIAMQFDTLSWHFLRRSPCYFQGLEDSWAYDPLLDHNDPFDDELDEEDRPSAGDILPSLGNLKRTASEMSRTPSFSAGSAGEGEGSRPKVPRTTTGACVPVPLELRRRVETV
ncbi:hypothetical protein JX265_012739 [Neoarthrinium moseri]|uniref:Uncharacterized protein n=1 Tax=Neoarthrinium moseri TaxID=1658444 RepID=A0A9P9WA22_9PEZI|nr:hypothetical protein JX265_012739 [Neoarthrinium moseri]